MGQRCGGLGAVIQYNTLSDKKQGSAPDGPIVDNGRRGGLEDTVEILGLKEGKPDAEGRRKVTVRVPLRLGA